MADLVVDLDLVSDTADRLDLVAREFDSADRYAETVAEAVGDETLADAVRSFANDWTERRAKMQESVANLAELTGAVAEQFRTVDTDLATSLEKDA